MTPTTTTTITHEELRIALVLQLADEKQMGADEKQLNHLANVFTDFHKKITGKDSLLG